MAYTPPQTQNQGLASLVQGAYSPIGSAYGGVDLSGQPVTQGDMAQFARQLSQLNLFSGMTQYLQGAAGYFVGFASKIGGITDGTPVFAVGNPAAQYIAWNGTTLSVIGNVTITGGTVTGALTVTTGGYFNSGQSAYNTGIGWWFEYNGGTPRMSMGNSAGNEILWTGTTLQVYNASHALIFDSSGLNTTGVNFQMGGGNLVPSLYSTYLGNTLPAFNSFATSATGLTVTQTTGTTDVFPQSLQVGITNTSLGVAVQLRAAAATANIPLVPSSKWIITADVAQAAANAGRVLEIDVLNSANTVLGTANLTLPTATGFNRLSAIVDLTAHTDASCYLKLQFITGWTNAETCYINYITMEPQIGANTTATNPNRGPSLVTIPGSNDLVGDQRNLPAITGAGVRGYWTTLTLTSAWVGTQPNLVFSGVYTWGNSTTTYNSTSQNLGAGNTGVSGQVYLDDPGMVGGTITPTFVAGTTNVFTLAQNNNRLWVGSITLATSGGGTGGSGGGGGKQAP